MEHQKGEIERQRDRLQKNLTFARNQVQRYFDLIKRIPRDDLPVGDLVGLLKLRDEMEQVTKEYFEEFEKDSGRPDADLAFYADLAEGLEQLSEISLELGQPEASRATSLDYFKVQERLAQRYPEELKYRTDLAAGYNGMAVASLAVGKENEALDWSQKALDALAALPQEARDSFDVRVQVAKTHSDRGGVYGRLGEPAKAADELLGALDLLKKAEQDDPDMAKFSDLFVTAAKISNNLAKQYFALDDRDKARAILEEAKRSLETDEGKEAADSEDYQVTLGMIELALSAVYEEDKDKEKRGAVLADAVPLWEKLVAEHPRVAQYKVALSHCYLVSAVIAGLEDGRLDDAQAQAQKALEIQKQLDEDDPDFLDAAADAGQTCLTLSGILSSKGRYAEALPWAEDAISRLEAAVQKDNAQKANKTNLAFARRARAEILTELGRYADALAAWDAALARGRRQAAAACALSQPVHLPRGGGGRLPRRPQRHDEGPRQGRPVPLPGQAGRRLRPGVGGGAQGPRRGPDRRRPQEARRTKLRAPRRSSGSKRRARCPPSTRATSCAGWPTRRTSPRSRTTRASGDF